MDSKIPNPPVPITEDICSGKSRLLAASKCYLMHSSNYESCVMLCCQCPSVPFTLAQDGGITLPRCRSDVTILCHCCCRTGLNASPSPCQSCSGPPMSHNFRHSLAVFPSLGQINLPCACWASGIATAVNPPHAALYHFVVVILFMLAYVALHTVHMWFDKSGKLTIWSLCPNLSLEKFFMLMLPVFPSLCLEELIFCFQNQLISLM